jgi:hypothetical protein
VRTTWKLFLSNNRQMINTITHDGQFNLFLPRSSGGLGWKLGREPTPDREISERISMRSRADGSRPKTVQTKSKSLESFESPSRRSRRNQKHWGVNKRSLTHVKSSSLSVEFGPDNVTPQQVCLGMKIKRFLLTPRTGWSDQLVDPRSCDGSRRKIVGDAGRYPCVVVHYSLPTGDLPYFGKQEVPELSIPPNSRRYVESDGMPKVATFVRKLHGWQLSDDRFIYSASGLSDAFPCLMESLDQHTVVLYSGLTGYHSAVPSGVFDLSPPPLVRRCVDDVVPPINVNLYPLESPPDHDEEPPTDESQSVGVSWSRQDDDIDYDQLERDFFSYEEPEPDYDEWYGR